MKVLTETIERCEPHFIRVAGVFTNAGEHVCTLSFIQKLEVHMLYFLPQNRGVVVSFLSPVLCHHPDGSEENHRYLHGLSV